MNSFWRFCLARFEKELPPQRSKTWIKPLRFHADGDRLTLIAPNRFVLQWIRDKFLTRIGELAREQLKREIDVQLSLDESEQPHPCRRLPSSNCRPRNAARRQVAEKFRD